VPFRGKVTGRFTEKWASGSQELFSEYARPGVKLQNDGSTGTGANCGGCHIRMTYIVALWLVSSAAIAQTPQHSRVKHRPATDTGSASSTVRPGKQTKDKLAGSVHTQQTDPESTDVTLESGMLTIVARNASLTKILEYVSQRSGMVIEGDIRESRVYGSYGPEDVPSVLSDLLLGLGYNIEMVGNLEQGVPRKLILTSRGGAASPPQPDRQPQSTPLPSPARLDEPTLGPGAIAHPPPATEQDEQMRTQRNLQRLQQMHQSQSQQGIPP